MRPTGDLGVLVHRRGHLRKTRQRDCEHFVDLHLTLRAAGHVHRRLVALNAENDGHAGTQRSRMQPHIAIRTRTEQQRAQDETPTKQDRIVRDGAA